MSKFNNSENPGPNPSEISNPDTAWNDVFSALDVAEKCNNTIRDMIERRNRLDSVLKQAEDLGRKFIKRNKNSTSDCDSDSDVEISEIVNVTANSATNQQLIPVPSLLLRGKLRHYQIEGMSWLIKLYNNGVNGALLDEMGLGKTCMSIALLCHLAAEKGIWGPHLIVVPKAVLFNWEQEFRRWAPSLKIMIYKGSVIERSQLRVGWSVEDAMHVCIVTYNTIVADIAHFKRIQWEYLILDEAHLIRNVKSQKWNALLPLVSRSRLMLTGTPLQNNVMDLWGFLHFLMPQIFVSREDFSQWFNKTLVTLTEKLIQKQEDERKQKTQQNGNDTNAESNEKRSDNSNLIKVQSEAQNSNENQVTELSTDTERQYLETITSSLVSKLHDILRPFVLRRMKKDVEKELPSKIEYLIRCPLSRRQQYLYDEYMYRRGENMSVKVQPQQGNNKSNNDYMSMMNILMQLRKICNHPDLLVKREQQSTFAMQASSCNMTVPFGIADIVTDLTQQAHQRDHRLLGNLTKNVNDNTQNIINFKSYQADAYRTYVSQDFRKQLSTSAQNLISRLKIYTPKVTALSTFFEESSSSLIPGQQKILVADAARGPLILDNNFVYNEQIQQGLNNQGSLLTEKNMKPFLEKLQIQQQSLSNQTDDNTSTAISSVDAEKNVMLQRALHHRLGITEAALWDRTQFRQAREIPLCTRGLNLSKNKILVKQQIQTKRRSIESSEHSTIINQIQHTIDNDLDLELNLNFPKRRKKVQGGCQFANAATDLQQAKEELLQGASSLRQDSDNDNDMKNSINSYMEAILKIQKRKYNTISAFDLNNCSEFTRHTHSTVAEAHQQLIRIPISKNLNQRGLSMQAIIAQKQAIANKTDTVKIPQIDHPKYDSTMLINDCGKLQILTDLLRECKQRNERCIIFTQFSKMLDILEDFVNSQRYRYLRFDGQTVNNSSITGTSGTEERQLAIQRFNDDCDCFLLLASTRASGTGINLTGANVVIFYDSDYNPTIDRQAMDRVHRIGQTKDVHVFRLISENTIEENIWKKQILKRRLDDLVIDKGGFNNVGISSTSTGPSFTREELANIFCGQHQNFIEREVKTTSSNRNRNVKGNSDQFSFFSMEGTVLHAQEIDQNLDSSGNENEEELDLVESQEILDSIDDDENIENLPPIDIVGKSS